MPMPSVLTPAPVLAAETLWTERFARRIHGLKSSAIRELLKLTEQPDVISFAGGLPAPEVFPIKHIEAAAHRVLETQGRVALQYGITEGYLPLRELLVRHMGRYGIRVTPANLLITSGAQQALDLIAKLLLDPGDAVLTEEPTFLSAIQTFTSYQAHCITVPLDDDGMRIDLLEAALRRGPKFMYVLPNFQNPAGVTLSLERRRALVELASRYGTPIVEDDPYGQLRYEGRHLPSLVRLDAEYHGCAHGERPFRGSVLYMGTLSKTLAPGLRIGWVVAPEEVVVRLVQLKQSADLHTSTFVQMVAYEAARGGFLDHHIPAIRSLYTERRNAMLAAMERHFPAGVRWTHPHGGLFLWVTLPPGVRADELLKDALCERVAFVPGQAFHPSGGGSGTFRLNFSYCTSERIEEGIARLGRVIQRKLAA